MPDNTIGKTKQKKRCFLAALLAVGLLFLQTGCAAATRLEKRSATYYLWFDTVTEIIGYDTAERFQRACELTAEILEKYHAAADIYHEYSGMVNACSVNLLAGSGPVAADEKLLELVEFGKEMYDITGGECNIALGSVLRLWHDAREKAESGQGTPPEESLLREAAEHCDIRNVLIDKTARTIELRDGKMSLDLGSIAKGYAAEKAAQALKEAGYTGYALNLGGNVRVLGTKPDGSDWVTGIQNPDTEATENYLVKVPISDTSLVTSGSYQRYFVADGVRYHHIIDPDTLYPENNFLSVTILTKDSGVADALSTAVFNMTLEEGRKFLFDRKDVEACWITKEREIIFSEGFPHL